MDDRANTLRWLSASMPWSISSTTRKGAARLDPLQNKLKIENTDVPPLELISKNAWLLSNWESECLFSQSNYAPEAGMNYLPEAELNLPI